MPEGFPYEISRLGRDDLPIVRALLRLFAEAFGPAGRIRSARASAAYLRESLGRDELIVLAAAADGALLGGIVAYELRKLEQQHSEIYLYDLAVTPAHRRRGIATALIKRLLHVAQSRGAPVVFVQTGAADRQAIALYGKFAPAEAVFQFDIEVHCSGLRG